MKYIPLNKLYYKKANYIEEQQKRMNSFDTVILPIKTADFAFYVVPNYEMMNLMQEIYHANNKVQALKHQLPGIAVDHVLNRLLIDEMMLTNEIEGVNSTRKEIIAALNAAEAVPKKRFYGMAKKYSLLMKDELNAYDYFTCSGLRQLYDDIVAPEIAVSEKPAGEFFRKEAVDVISATRISKHKGVYPENRIIEGIQNMEKIVKDFRLPWLIRIALVHYFIGYIHPFYDGNGRINRFISSAILRRQLGKIPALYLSSAIKNNIKLYYEAFEIGNDKKNNGDLTPFVLMFLELVKEAVTSAYENFNDSREKMSYYMELLARKKMLLNVIEKRMAEALIQVNLFVPYKEFNETELMNILQETRYIIQKTCDRLRKMGFPIVVTKTNKGKIYDIDLDEFEQFVNN
ncbi:MAG: Fic family protein [Syntrophomonadaceae bacterium]|jgi:Fic family protein|nr:Fic family protein [Syntrophomonadaceae bacterium]